MRFSDVALHAILAVAFLATANARLSGRTALVPARPHVQFIKRQACETGYQLCDGTCCTEEGECCGSTCYNPLPYRKHSSIRLYCEVVLAAMRGKCLPVIVRHREHADRVDQLVLHHISWRSRVLLPKRRKLYHPGLILWHIIAKCRLRQRLWSLRCLCRVMNLGYISLTVSIAY